MIIIKWPYLFIDKLTIIVGKLSNNCSIWSQIKHKDLYDCNCDLTCKIKLGKLTYVYINDGLNGIKWIKSTHSLTYYFFFLIE